MTFFAILLQTVLMGIERWSRIGRICSGDSLAEGAGSQFYLIEQGKFLATMTILNILLLLTICIFGKSNNAMILKTIKLFDEDEIKQMNEDEENRKAKKIEE